MFSFPCAIHVFLAVFGAIFLALAGLGGLFTTIMLNVKRFEEIEEFRTEVLRLRVGFNVAYWIIGTVLYIAGVISGAMVEPDWIFGSEKGVAALAAAAYYTIVPTALLFVERTRPPRRFSIALAFGVVLLLVVLLMGNVIGTTVHDFV